MAYRGFVDSIPPDTIDVPIAICMESITDDGGAYNCNIGRMFNQDIETAAWTDYNQDEEPVCSAPKKSDIDDAICSEESPQIDGELISTTNGVVDDTFKKLIDCWETNTNKTEAWKVIMPVVECGDSKPNCKEVVGAVELYILLIVRNAYTQGANAYDEVPASFEAIPPPNDIPAWSAEGKVGLDRWKSFVDQFGLQDVETGSPETDEEYESFYKLKTIYFLPSCEEVELSGTSGGLPFNVFSDIPVLVD